MRVQHVPIIIEELPVPSNRILTIRPWWGHRKRLPMHIVPEPDLLASGLASNKHIRIPEIIVGLLAKLRGVRGSSRLVDVVQVQVLPSRNGPGTAVVGGFASGGASIAIAMALLPLFLPGRPVLEVGTLLLSGRILGSAWCTGRLPTKDIPTLVLILLHSRDNAVIIFQNKTP